MHTLDFERVTSEKLGGVLWVLDRLEEHVGDERGRLARRSAASSRPRGSSPSAPPGSSTAAEPAAAASAMAKLAGARVTQRVADAAVDLLGLDGLADGDAGVAGRGPRRGALPRVGRLDDLGRDGRGAAARDRAAGARAVTRRRSRACASSSTRSTSRARCAASLLARPRRRGDQGRASRGRRLPLRDAGRARASGATSSR